MDALKTAQCMDIIDKLPQGIHIVIGQKGTYLSGGEQQRIAIARAVLKDGVVAEDGTPEELLGRDGIYKHMCEVQRRSAGWKM